jgi:hypothetical protein
MVTAMNIDIADCYWRLEDGQIWHSGRASYVAGDDGNLTQWAAATGLAPITSRVDLVRISSLSWQAQ